jgi:hypothetical protein
MIGVERLGSPCDSRDLPDKMGSSKHSTDGILGVEFVDLSRLQVLIFLVLVAQ